MKRDNISLYREKFPGIKEKTYLNHASTGLLSTVAKKAIEECLEIYSTMGDYPVEEYFSLVQEIRKTIAKFLNAEEEEIALTTNTSQGLLIALMNISLKEGDKIIAMEEMFLAGKYVLKYNFPYVETMYVKFRGRDPVEVVREKIDSKVKAVVIDWVQFFSGDVVDLKYLSDFLQEKDIYLIVDGIQGIGAIPFDAKELDVDFLSSGGAKWLFSPAGTGFLYINKRNFNRIKRFYSGWLGAKRKDFSNLQDVIPVYEDARKYEIGTRNIMGLSALKENIKILLEYGMENVYRRITGLKEMLFNGFEDMKLNIVTERNGIQSGIITVKPDGNPEILYKKLTENRVVVSLRNGHIRISPHFYNTEEDIERLFSVWR